MKALQVKGNTEVFFKSFDSFAKWLIGFGGVTFQNAYPTKGEPEDITSENLEELVLANLKNNEITEIQVTNSFYSGLYEFEAHILIRLIDII